MRKNPNFDHCDQLRGYREVDLRLCFCICRLLVFSEAAHLSSIIISCYSHIAKKPCLAKLMKGYPHDADGHADNAA